MRAALYALLIWLVSVQVPLSVPYAPNFGEVGFHLPAPAAPSISGLLTQAEQRHGLPDGLLRAVAWVESRKRTHVVGAQGEVGIMQLHPRWHRVPATVEGQIDYAAGLLAGLIEQHGLELGIAAYNQGPTNPRMSRYVRLVKEAWGR